MRSISRALVVLAATAAAVATIGPVASAKVSTAPGDDRQTRTITAVGTGIIEGTPDVLELNLGVSTRERTAAAALARNSALAEKVAGILRLGGVAEKDVQTSGLSISPVLDDDSEHVVAYAVENTVVAEIHDIGSAGKIVDAATKASDDSIVVNGLYFSFDDNSRLVSAARSEAVKRAKAQATQLADAAGVELGDLVSIDEDGTPTGPPLPVPTAEAADRVDPPISAGTETTTVDVTLVYAIR